jgi:hypothetical protein
MDIETPEQTENEQQQQPQIDPAQVEIALQELRSEQNLTLGIIGGIVAALAGAAVWAVVTVTTGFQIGWMAVGVGFLVGIAVRTLGKGMDTTFGIAGAILALLGCLLGNLFAVCGMIASQQEMGFFDVLSQLNLQLVGELMVATFSPMDLLFYGIAIYDGYKLSFRQVSEEELVRRISG